MVSLTEIRNRLQRSFTADQADLIANLHVEMHDQLVTRHDFAELRSVVERLAESQQQLAESQQRTEHRVEELAESQRELVESQRGLADAQRRTEHAVKDLAKQVGGLAATAGGNLEAYASERIPEVLAERFGFVMESCGSESIEAEGKAYEFDAVLRGTINGRPVVVLCEVKTNISESEVRGFLRIAERVRKALAQETGEADVRPLFFGYRAAVVTQKMITSSDAWLVFPRGLVTAA
jgi:predicted nuclease with TOPRIM domain